MLSLLSFCVLFWHDTDIDGGLAIISILLPCFSAESFRSVYAISMCADEDLFLCWLMPVVSKERA